MFHFDSNSKWNRLSIQRYVQLQLNASATHKIRCFFLLMSYFNCFNIAFMSLTLEWCTILILSASFFLLFYFACFACLQCHYFPYDFYVFNPRVTLFPPKEFSKWKRSTTTHSRRFYHWILQFHFFFRTNFVEEKITLFEDRRSEPIRIKHELE